MHSVEDEAWSKGGTFDKICVYAWSVINWQIPETSILSQFDALLKRH